MRIPNWLRKRLLDKAIDVMAARPANLTIREQHGKPAVLRWYLIPRNKWFNVYAHRWVRPNDPRALHDHPWWNATIVLEGTIIEVVSHDGHFEPRGHFSSGDVLIRRPTDKHRVDLQVAYSSGPITTRFKPATTLFITGPTVREWGFWCGERFVHWRVFTAGGRGEFAGPGCDQ